MVASIHWVSSLKFFDTKRYGPSLFPLLLVSAAEAASNTWKWPSPSTAPPQQMSASGSQLKAKIYVLSRHRLYTHNKPHSTHCTHPETGNKPATQHTHVFYDVLWFRMRVGTFIHPSVSVLTLFLMKPWRFIGWTTQSCTFQCQRSWQRYTHNDMGSSKPLKYQYVLASGYMSIYSHHCFYSSFPLLIKQVIVLLHKYLLSELELITR